MNKEKDFTDGDHSFNNWLRVVAIDNVYLELFVLFLAATIISLFFPNIIGTVPGENVNLCIAGFTGLITLFISYKGLYQKWNDLKKGRTR